MSRNYLHDMKMPAKSLENVEDLSAQILMDLLLVRRPQK